MPLYLLFFFKLRSDNPGYHGAEHKVSNAFKKRNLNFEFARLQSRFSESCGGQLFNVLLLGYCLVALTDKIDEVIFLMLLALNIFFPKLSIIQWMNTREPTDQELLIGIAAMEALIKKEIEAGS